MMTLRLVSKNLYSEDQLEGREHQEYNGMEIIGVQCTDLGRNMRAVRLAPDGGDFAKALEETEWQYPAKVVPFSDMGLDAEEMGIYDVTNEQKYYGAVSILFPSVQKRLQKIFGQGLFLIPSSVHEWLAMPLWAADANDLPEMVRTVNRESVEPRERLADTAYIANFSEDGEICLRGL